MEKNKLMSFISKYSLGGNVDSAEWKIDSEGISTRFITDDQNAIGDISIEFKNENITNEITFGIANTPLLVKMLSVLNDEINVDLITRAGLTPESLKISDGDSVVTYMIADPSIIKKAPNAREFPDPTYEFSFSKETLVDKFLKAKAAFPDENKFTITQNKKDLNLIVGSSLNKVAISIKSDLVGIPTRNISFDSKYFKEMLTSNKEMISGKFSVYERGIAKVEFKHESASVSYFLMEM
jgi:hypothetical protein